MCLADSIALGLILLYVVTTTVDLIKHEGCVDWLSDNSVLRMGLVLFACLLGWFGGSLAR